MKRGLISILILTTIIIVGYSQSFSKRYTIAFYNVENLFDTINSPNVNDIEFTPTGSNRWNSAKYYKKLTNLDEVFYTMAMATKGFPTMIGLAEIENRNVLEDLVSQPNMLKANYQIAHFDSPDARGVDVALLYRPDQFFYKGSKPIRYTLSENPRFRTRDILMAWGEIDGELFHVFVAHFPSRRGGQAESDHLRVRAAQIIRQHTDSLMALYPKGNIIIMGDMNDDPINNSIYSALNAKGDHKKLKDGELFNPFYSMFKAGFGTLAYQDQWNLFDMIIVNDNLIKRERDKLSLYKPKKNKFYGNIFDRPFLRQQSGQFKNYPFRTYVGSNFQGGYSDHFPVFIYIAKP